MPGSDPLETDDPQTVRNEPVRFEPARFDRDEDTTPQMAVDVPLSSAEAGRAAGDVSSVLLIRSVVAGVATVLLLVAAVLLFRHGVRPDNFPPFVSGTTRTVITRYSAPWIAGAAGVCLLAGLSFTSFGVDLFRRVRLQRARRG